MRHRAQGTDGSGAAAAAGHAVLAGAALGVWLILAAGSVPARAAEPPAPDPAAGAGAQATNDYPTAARADYVFACMAVNGGSREALQRCSCSVDVIASILPFDSYERAETVLSMRQGRVGGYLGEEFRQANTNDMVRALEEAQAEAEVRCF